MHTSDEKLFSLAEATVLIPRFELIIKRMQCLKLRIRQEMELLAFSFGQCAHDMAIAQLCQRKPKIHRMLSTNTTAD
jgi:hypothetical protein